jgi:hypothetical protein
VSLYRLDRVSSYRFDFANRLGKIKANILTLIIALLGLSFLGIHYGSKPWTPTQICWRGDWAAIVGASGARPNRTR